MQFKINPKKVLKKLRYLLACPANVIILFGSSSSGKSFQIMFFAVFWALQGRNVLIARKEGNQINRSVWSEIKKAIARHSLGLFFTFHKSDRMIIPKFGKGSIVFTGVDDENKLKSITPPVGDAFDTVIMEEADSFTEDDFDQLRTRQRGLCNFPKRIILLFNPVSLARLKWCWERYFKALGWDDEADNYKEGEVLCVDEDGNELYEKVIIHRALYQDNEYLDADDKMKFAALKRDNPRKYRVFGEGKFGASGETVFDVNKYHKSDFDVGEVLQRGYLPRFGGDFGFVHNGTVIMSLWNKKKSTIYVFDMDCRNKTVKEDLAPIYVALLDKHGYSRKQAVLFDYAEPASIKTLQTNELLGASKCAAKDVAAQTDFLQSQTIIIHESCKQLYEEMEALNFKKVNGVVTEDWDDSYGDDSIKGLAYAYSYEALQFGTSVVGSQIDF